MKLNDPLFVLALIVGAGLLLMLGRFAVTGELSEALLSVMATIIGGLITALSTRKKDKDGGGPDDS